MLCWSSDSWQTSDSGFDRKIQTKTRAVSGGAFSLYGLCIAEVKAVHRSLISLSYTRYQDGMKTKWISSRSLCVVFVGAALGGFVEWPWVVRGCRWVATSLYIGTSLLFSFVFSLCVFFLICFLCASGRQRENATYYLLSFLLLPCTPTGSWVHLPFIVCYHHYHLYVLRS